MQIQIKNCQGKSIAYTVNATDTVKSIKEKVFAVEGIPIVEQRLVFGGKQLDDENTLDHYNIQKDSTIYLILRLKGGL